MKILYIRLRTQILDKKMDWRKSSGFFCGFLLIQSIFLVPQFILRLHFHHVFLCIPKYMETIELNTECIASPKNKTGIDKGNQTNDGKKPPFRRFFFLFVFIWSLIKNKRIECHGECVSFENSWGLDIRFCYSTPNRTAWNQTQIEHKYTKIYMFILSMKIACTRLKCWHVYAEQTRGEHEPKKKEINDYY